MTTSQVTGLLAELRLEGSDSTRVPSVELRLQDLSRLASDVQRRQRKTRATAARRPRADRDVAQWPTAYRRRLQICCGSSGRTCPALSDDELLAAANRFHSRHAKQFPGLPPQVSVDQLRELLSSSPLPPPSSHC